MCALASKWGERRKIDLLMWDFLRAGGIFMFPLVLASVVGLTFIIERGLALRWSKVIPPSVEDAANSFPLGSLEELKQVCERDQSTFGRLLLVACEHLDHPREEAIDALQTQARREILQLERGLVVLEIVVGIAPLLGLVGAIYGLIHLFGTLGAATTIESTVLAKGISEALNTTLMGLLIAIPCLSAWSYYNKKVESLAVEMETLCDGFLRRMHRELQQP